MRKLLGRAGRTAAVAALVAAALLAVPGTASADRCQPEELIGSPPLMPESDNPVCIVMLDVVYPAVSCDETTLARCLATLNALATVQAAPGTAAQTPGRVLGTVPKIQQGIQNQVRGSCVWPGDIRWAGDYFECRIDEIRSKIE